MHIKNIITDQKRLFLRENVPKEYLIDPYLGNPKPYMLWLFLKIMMKLLA